MTLRTQADTHCAYDPKAQKWEEPHMKAKTAAALLALVTLVSGGVIERQADAHRATNEAGVQRGSVDHSSRAVIPSPNADCQLTEAQARSLGSTGQLSKTDVEAACERGWSLESPAGGVAGN